MVGLERSARPESGRRSRLRLGVGLWIGIAEEVEIPGWLYGLLAGAVAAAEVAVASFLGACLFGARSPAAMSVACGIQSVALASGWPPLAGFDGPVMQCRLP
jgi:hypothetical protein